MTGVIEAAVVGQVSEGQESLYTLIIVDKQARLDRNTCQSVKTSSSLAEWGDTLAMNLSTWVMYLFNDMYRSGADLG